MDPLDDINDTRSGILLNGGFHLALDAGDIAFLMVVICCRPCLFRATQVQQTPNFALTVDDIPYRQPPNAGSLANRLTLQHIQPSPFGPMLSRFGSHNSDARQPQDISQWPLAVIVDLSYAAIALRAWGPKTFFEYVRANSRDYYYKGGVGGDVGEDASGDPTAQVPHQPARTVRHDRRSANKARAVCPADQPTHEELFDVVLALWMRGGREAQRERRLPGSGAAYVADNENKVQTWLQSMEESEHAQERLERNSPAGGQDSQPNEPGSETVIPGGVHSDTECLKGDRNVKFLRAKLKRGLY